MGGTEAIALLADGSPVKDETMKIRATFRPGAVFPTGILGVSVLGPALAAQTTQNVSFTTRTTPAIIGATWGVK